MKFRMASVVLCQTVMLVLCGCSTPPPLPLLPHEPLQPAEPWPLARGMRWIYAGTAIHSAVPSAVVTNAVRLTCEVLDAHLQRGFLVATLRGFPLAVSPWEAPQTNALEVLIRTPAGAFHAMEANQARHVLARLADAKDPLDDLLEVDTQILAWPLQPDQRWGDEAATQRLDAMNCWRVYGRRDEHLHDIPGIYKGWNLAVFQVAYRSLPEWVAFDFAPGIGLLGCDYVHHGAPGEIHLKLVEFQAPSLPVPAPVGK